MGIALKFLFHFGLMILFEETNARIDVFDFEGKMIDSFRDREAQCTGDFDESKGYIALANPIDACTPISPPTFLTNFTYDRIVLINGSETCPLVTKVSNAQRSGFTVVVLYDRSLFPYQCISLGPDLNMPVVYVSSEDGLVIKNNYIYNNSKYNNYVLLIRPNAPDMRYYMYLFGGVIGVCFFVMLLFMICLIIKCLQERRKNRRNRLSSRQIKQIPTAKFQKGDQYDICAICLEDYNEGEKLRILPCSHAYHVKCIDPWLMNNRRNCPLCKRKITLGDTTSDSESEDSELTSPTENTPLIGSQANHSPRRWSWGTFAGNSLEQEIGRADTRTVETATSPNTLYDDTSDDEECLSPVHSSVNNDKDSSAQASGQSTVDVSCETNGIAANSQRGYIV